MADIYHAHLAEPDHQPMPRRAANRPYILGDN